MNGASVIVLSVMKRCHEGHARWARVGDTQCGTCVPFSALGAVFVAPPLAALSQTLPEYPIHAQVPLRFCFQS